MPPSYKTQSKFNLILGQPNGATGAPLLGVPKSIYYYPFSKLLFSGFLQFNGNFLNAKKLKIP